MPKGKTKAFYEEFLQNYTTDLDDADDAFDSEKEKVQGHLGPIFPQYGSVFLSFWSKKAAFLSYRLLQEEMTDLRVDVLPNINSRYLKICNLLIRDFTISDFFLSNFEFSKWCEGPLSLAHFCERKIRRWPRRKSFRRAPILFFKIPGAI